MTKVTLDETQYDTDDFTDLQKNMLSEINYNNNLQTQLSYTLQSVRTSADILLTKLKDNLSRTTAINTIQIPSSNACPILS